jgi:GNAT superfamily N-acetyltransferase
VDDFVIEEWPRRHAGEARLDQEIDMLAEVLHAAVYAGASVSFIAPFTLSEARAFWCEKVLPNVRRGTRRVLTAATDGEIAGTVQLNLDVPLNQRHRAEIVKLLVHPKARRRGIGRALMMAIEQVAKSEGRTLLTPDTRRGDAAEPLYLSMGYVLAGVIPRYARGPLKPDLEDTSILYKETGGRAE